MKADATITIAGATGLVGSEILTIMESREFPSTEIRLLASQDSVGEVYNFNGQELEVSLLNEEAFVDSDIVLFATNSELSKQFVPHALKAGAFVIDNSSSFRMDAEVPLVVPEVNLKAITKNTKLIANPNCSTIQLVPVLKCIHELGVLKHVVVSTYQSVSGAGKAALDELWSQCLAVFNQREVVTEEFQHQIAFNCIPQIDLVLNNGFTKEEWKIITESRKILSLPDLRITATAVRVPVFYGHSESVFVETEKPVTPDALVKLLSETAGMAVFPDPAEYPMQLGVAGQDEIHVGRIRQDLSVPNGLSLWVVADNVRKGAALNAVQIAEHVLSIM